MQREEYKLRLTLISEWDQALADVMHAYRQAPELTEEVLANLMQLEDPTQLVQLDAVPQAFVIRLMRIGLCQASMTIADTEHADQRRE